MFVKNVFRNKIKKINKKLSEQVKFVLNKPEYILFNFSENVYLPEDKKDEEVVHCTCEKYCNLLRKIRDKPEIFIDYIKKYGFNKPTGICDDSLKFYIDRKTKSLKGTLTKLALDEQINNIKIISNRIKNSFIVHETNENALKTFDSSSSFLFMDYKEEVNFKLVDKIRNASVVIMASKKDYTELKKRNYVSVGNNLFVKN
jgi:hypothetical protein